MSGKQKSIAMLWTHSVLPSVLLILLAVAAVQSVMFWQVLERTIETAEETAYAIAENGGWAVEESLWRVNFERVLVRSGFVWTAAAGFVLLCVGLCLPGCSFSSRTQYTLQRLSVSRRSVFFWQAGVNFSALALYWVWQILVAVGLFGLFCHLAGDSAWGPQTLRLAFYRVGYLHGLLPLADWPRWMRTAVLIVSQSIALANFPARQRLGRLSFGAVFLTALLLIFFSGGMAGLEADVFVTLCCVWTAGYIIYTVLGKEPEDEA